MRGSLRIWHQRLLWLLGVLCAAYWFGDSGAGLVLLWRESRRGSASATLPDAHWLRVLEDEPISFAHLGTWRIVVVGERSGRREVYRDELSEMEWTRLRRRCLAIGQPDAASSG